MTFWIVLWGITAGLLIGALLGWHGALNMTRDALRLCADWRKLYDETVRELTRAD